MSGFKLKRGKKPNLLVLGASGGVANAFLHHLPACRYLFNKLFLLDKNKKLLSDPYVNHECLNYKFIHYEIKLPEKESEYINILKKNKIDIVLDITDYESIPLVEATNKASVRYINTAMNAEKRYVSDLIFDIYPRKHQLNNASHILCSGMNPGVVNMWVRYGIEKFGVPKEVIHFEYDSSQEASGWHPMMTWSIHEFLVESIRDPSGYMLGRNNLKQLFPDALKHRTPMKQILSPIMHLNKYPHGLTVLHEENLTVAQKYDIPSKFIYAVNMKTMDYLENLYDKKHNVLRKNLDRGDNTKKVLDGSDSIGVLLSYKDKDVYYFNRMPNGAFMGTNATFTQVIVGIFAALFTIMFDKLSPGIHFVEDLYDTNFKHYIFDNMRIQEFIFKKQGNKLKLKEYNPEVKIKENHSIHPYEIY